MVKQSYKTLAIIRSFTDPNKKYLIKQREADGRISCGCPAWIFNRSGDRTCKHLDAILHGKDPIEKLLFQSGKYTLIINGEQWELDSSTGSV